MAFPEGSITILVDRIHDTVLDAGQSFLLDGTFARLEIARKNVERSLKRERTVHVLYVYQEPLLAWRFVQAREAAEGRNIPASRFVDQYFGAREVVNELKSRFGKNLHVDLLIKNNDNSHQGYHAGVDRIDFHVPERHSRAEVEEMIKEA